MKSCDDGFISPLQGERFVMVIRTPGRRALGYFISRLRREAFSSYDKLRV
jgi:hypothetical protein